MIIKNLTVTLLVGALALVAPVSSRADAGVAKTNKLDKEVAEAVELFKKTDSDIAKLFSNAAGYVIFPGVAKGAAGIGAAHGKGQVFAQGKLIGTAKLTQVTIGFQLGGQKYAEVIFFETKNELNNFVRGQWEMSAQASAVAAADGASANAKYDQGVLVFTLAKGGLMFEASVGGQKFSFEPLNKQPLY